MIHHKEDKPGFVICPDKLTTVNTRLKNILRDWFVKVYIIHKLSISNFGGEVKEYRITPSTITNLICWFASLA